MTVDNENNVFLNNFNIYSVTKFIIEDTLSKLTKVNKEFVDSILKRKTERDLYEFEKNEQFLKSVRKRIKTNLIQYQKDWFGIFQKYLWINQFYNWNIHETKQFKKFNNH